MATAELIRRGARRFRERTAVLCGDDSLTFGEVDELANRVASVLLALQLAEHPQPKMRADRFAAGEGRLGA